MSCISFKFFGFKSSSKSPKTRDGLEAGTKAVEVLHSKKSRDRCGPAQSSAFAAWVGKLLRRKEQASSVNAAVLPPAIKQLSEDISATEASSTQPLRTSAPKAVPYDIDGAFKEHGLGALRGHGGAWKPQLPSPTFEEAGVINKAWQDRPLSSDELTTLVTSMDAERYWPPAVHPRADRMAWKFVVPVGPDAEARFDSLDADAQEFMRFLVSGERPLSPARPLSLQLDQSTSNSELNLDRHKTRFDAVHHLLTKTDFLTRLSDEDGTARAYFLALYARLALEDTMAPVH